MHKENNAIVIGSGVGGMAVAIRLALQGLKVTVYEQQDGPGGKLTAFEQNGFRFDAGPSLFTQPENLVELFEAANEPIAEYLQYEALPEAFRYFFENGKKVKAYTDPQQYREEMQEQLGEPAENLKTYLDHSAETYEQAGQLFLNHSLHKRKTWLQKKSIGALRKVRFHQLFRTLHQYNQHHFKTPEAVQIFNRYATYNGSNPYQAPGMLSVIPHLEQTMGTYYPKGGMISITNALYRLALKKGVTFHFNTPVQRIIQHEGKVKGVVVNNQNLGASVVVSNVDVYFTYLQLLGNTNKAKRILKQERSSSAIIFYWGMNRSFPQLGLHNIFFSNDYQQEFQDIFKAGRLSQDPTVYINITSKLEQGMAPEGQENWFVMVNAPANTGQNWEALKSQIKVQILSKLERMLGEEIASAIVTEEQLDPVTIESKTSSYQGSLYGTSSNSKWAAFARHPNFTSTVQGLYFCGGSVHPGGGIPLCLKSADIVGQQVAADARKLFAHH